MGVPKVQSQGQVLEPLRGTEVVPDVQTVWFQGADLGMSEVDPLADVRVPVQASEWTLGSNTYSGEGHPGSVRRAKTEPGAVPGTVAWAEHELAWEEYARRYGRSQTAERLAQRGGFSWLELVVLLGREPTTWLST